MTTVAAVPLIESPYRYLDYFHEGDPTFAGRDEDVAEVVARASDSEPFVLYGRSGLGKTSLLLAGVFPQLRARGLNPLLVRVFQHPLLDLRNAIAESLGHGCGTDGGDLFDLARRAAADSGLVLVFDQFEELFLSTRRTPGVRREFVKTLAALLNDPRGDVRLTFSLREDYLAELDDFREGFPHILANQYRLRPLTAFGARQAITAPLIARGIPFDQGLVVKLVDLLAKEDFDPLLLQIACGEVYNEARRRTGDVHLTEADLDSVGNLDALFTRYLTNAIAAITEEAPGQVLLTRAILDALVTPDETKRAVKIEDLQANQDFRASADEIEAVLGRLERHKIIRKDLRAGELWYELRHDRLAPSVVRWFHIDPDFARFRHIRNLIAEAARRATYPELASLLSPSQLSLIEPYHQRLHLTPPQRELMFWSAVNACADNVDYWAGLFGRERCADVLRALLRHESPEARLGAAEAIARLHIGESDLPDECLAAALNDAVPEVRRAAARALATTASRQQIDSLRSALALRRALALRHGRARRRTWSHALDVLAVFVEQDGPIREFSRRWRVLARRRVHRLRVERHRQAIAARGRVGAVAGVLAAVASSITLGVLAVWLTLWARGATTWLDISIYQASVGVIGSSILGGAWGWWLGRKSASRAASRGKEGAAIHAVLAPVVAAALLTFLLTIGDSEMGELMVIYVALPTLLVAVTALYVRLFRPAFWPPTTERRERLVSAWLLGIPAAMLVGWYVTTQQAAPFEGEFFLMVALVSLPTITAVVLTETAAAARIGVFRTPHRLARLLARGLLAVSFVAAPLWFVSQLGLDTIPLLARTYPIDEPAEIPVAFRDEGADSAYFRIVRSDADVSWVEVEYPGGAALHAGARDRLEFDYSSGFDQRRDLLLVPPGNHLMAVSPVPYITTSQQPVRLFPVPVLRPETAIHLPDAGWSLFLLRLEEQTPARRQGTPTASQPARTWRGVQTVSLAATSTDLAVRMSVLVRDQSDAVRLRQATERGPEGNDIPYALPTPWTVLSSRLASSGPQPQYPLMRPLRIEPGGRFTVGLTVELTADQVSALPPGADPGKVMYVPVALGRPDFVDRIEAGEPVDSVLTWLRQRPEIWDDVRALEAAASALAQRTAINGDALHREIFRRILELAPRDADLLNSVAWSFVTANNGAKVVDLARQASRLTNDADYQILDTLAHAEFDAGNWAAAARAWERTLKINPEFTANDSFCADDLTKLATARRNAAAAR